MAKFILSAFCDEASEKLDEQIQALKENKIGYAELRNVEGNIVDLSERKLKEIAKAFDYNDLKVWAIGSPIGKVKINEPIGKELERLKRAINAAKILDTDRLRIFSFFVESQECEKYQNLVFENMAKLLDLAEQNDILMCHENEKGIFGDTYENVQKLMREFKDRLRYVFDGANFIHSGDNSFEVFQKMVDKIDYIHIKDAKKSSGAIVPAGYGDCDYPKMIDILSKQNKDIVLSIEPHLAVFSGLNNLQSEQLISELSFESQRVAFDFAVSAIKKILRGEYE